MVVINCSCGCKSMVNVHNMVNERIRCPMCTQEHVIKEWKNYQRKIKIDKIKNNGH